MQDTWSKTHYTVLTTTQVSLHQVPFHAKNLNMQSSVWTHGCMAGPLHRPDNNPAVLTPSALFSHRKSVTAGFSTDKRSNGRRSATGGRSCGHQKGRRRGHVCQRESRCHAATIEPALWKCECFKCNTCNTCRNTCKTGTHVATHMATPAVTHANV